MNSNLNLHNGGFLKYPKTKHISPFADNNGNFMHLLQSSQWMVVEEKMDGTQVGISLDKNDDIQIQSRGTIITTEKEFSLLKNWIWQYMPELLELLGKRYILFGEWLYAKHTMFYDTLPCYLMEFDIYDRDNQIFLCSHKRQQLLQPFGFIHSVNIIDRIQSPSLSKLQKMIRISTFTSEKAFQKIERRDLHLTDTTGLMEGLYIKIEDSDSVLNRFKLVRPEFIQKIVDSGSHWKNRKLTKNELK